MNPHTTDEFSKAAPLERQTAVYLQPQSEQRLPTTRSWESQGSSSINMSTDSVDTDLPAVLNCDSPTMNQAPRSSSLEQLSALSAGLMPLVNSGRKRKHPVKPGKHICKYCGRAWAKPSVLEKHIRKHTGERPFPCQICNLSFKTKSNLYKHMKSLTHSQKLKEKGLPIDSTADESFASSKDESTDIIDPDGSMDEENNSNHASYSRSGSFGSVHSFDSHNKKLEGMASQSLETNSALFNQSQSTSQQFKDQEVYIDALRQFEAADDWLEKWAESSTFDVKVYSHSLNERVVSVGIKLTMASSVPVALLDQSDPIARSVQQSSEDDSAFTSHTTTGSFHVQDKITKLLQANERIMDSTEPPRRRLSRQSSVSSPANSMFASSVTPNSSIDRMPSISEERKPLASNFSTTINTDSLKSSLESAISMALPQSSQPTTNLLLTQDVRGSNSALEVIFTLPPLDDQLLSCLKLDGHKYAPKMVRTGQKQMAQTCQSCYSLFSREFTLDLHQYFFCPLQHKPKPLIVESGKPSGSRTGQKTKIPSTKPGAHSFDEIYTLERKRMKLAKAGSDDAYFLSTDNTPDQKKFSRSKSELPPSSDSHPFLRQHSKDFNDVTPKQQLKKHLMKNRSQGSVTSSNQPQLATQPIHSTHSGLPTNLAQPTSLSQTTFIAAMPVQNTSSMPDPNSIPTIITTPPKPTGTAPSPPTTNLTALSANPVSINASLTSISTVPTPASASPTLISASLTAASGNPTHLSSPTSRDSAVSSIPIELRPAVIFTSQVGSGTVTPSLLPVPGAIPTPARNWKSAHTATIYKPIAPALNPKQPLMPVSTVSTSSSTTLQPSPLTTQSQSKQPQPIAPARIKKKSPSISKSASASKPSVPLDVPVSRAPAPDVPVSVPEMSDADTPKTTILPGQSSVSSTTASTSSTSPTQTLINSNTPPAATTVQDTKPCLTTKSSLSSSASKLRRSRSSVSFEEPAQITKSHHSIIHGPHIRYPISKSAIISPRTVQQPPELRPNILVARSQESASVTSSILESSPSQSASQSIIQSTTDTGVSASSSGHLIQSLTVSAQLRDLPGEMLLAPRPKPGQEGLSFECRPNFCTCQPSRPSERVLMGVMSNYLIWNPSRPPSHSLSLDFTISMSCYDSNPSRYGRTYTEAQTEKKSILTHSSYWKYKHKIRYMHDMPSIVSAIGPTTAKPSATVPVTKELEVSPPAVSLPVSVVSTVVKQATTETTVKSELSFTATTPSTSESKKLLHRSQSTPGGDHKTVGLVGGFKSNEDYVYVRGRGKGQYVCKQCGIRCRKPSMLQKHIRTHTDLRPYSCKHCRFSFKTKGNLTKHMKSKAHHRKCHELKIDPVPTTVDDCQIDKDILECQQQISKESKIKGAGGDVEEDDSDDDGVPFYEDPVINGSGDDDSSTDGALQIDEDADDEELQADSVPTLPVSSAAAFRRAQSMPASHMANSLDLEPAEEEKQSVKLINTKPLKKRHRNYLELSIPTTKQSKLEDADAAMSLLCLAKTPVSTIAPVLTAEQVGPSSHTDKIDHLIGALKAHQPSDQTEITSASSRVSVVRSTGKTPHTSMESFGDDDNNDEPMDLSVSTSKSQPPKLKHICPLCRAICTNQEMLDEHMKNHRSPAKPADMFSEGTAPGKLKRKRPSNITVNPLNLEDAPVVTTPKVQTPSQLKRQQAVTAWNESDAEEDEVDHMVTLEPGEKPSDMVKRRMCPYCPKVFRSASYLPIHLKNRHLIAQEYVCNYKDCGTKFTSKQELTFHLGTHALDDNEEYKPITIPKCGACGKTFKTMSGLKQHSQQHADIRSHICEYCDAGFTTAQSLKLHLKTHTQERPYICGECGSTFARSDHLQQHSKTHKRSLSHQSSSEVMNSDFQPTILSSVGSSSSGIHHQGSR